jgi:hypothetical protein
LHSAVFFAALVRRLSEGECNDTTLKNLFFCHRYKASTFHRMETSIFHPPAIFNYFTFRYPPFQPPSLLYDPTITPPLGCKLCPLINPLSLPARNTKQAATSLGCPGLPIGLVNSFCAWSLMVAGISGVQIGPGHTQFARMPLPTCWLDRARVKATMAPLVAV